MRIRKNAGKFSTTSPSSSNSLTKTHLNCQLNQSPWDIITFPPLNSDYSPPSPLHHFQLEGEFGFSGNGSFGSSSHSIGANYSDESVRAFIESEVVMNKVEELDFDDEEEETQVGFKDGEEDEEKMMKEEDDIVLCCETNGKGWQCGRVVKKGNNVCARHMKKGVVSEAANKSTTETTPVRRGRGRPRIKKKEPAPTPNPAPTKAQEPNEFYYYSGFGPLWGKKKGPGRSTNGDASGTDRESSAAKISQKNEEIDYMECDDDDDEEDVEHEIGKKRGRKRIKARSLKSLM